MSIVVPSLFAFAALFAVATTWRMVASNIAAIADLRRRAGMPSYGSEIVVNLREQLADFQTLGQMRRGRQVRHPIPKPVTHRLHQFACGRDAA